MTLSEMIPVGVDNWHEATLCYSDGKDAGEFAFRMDGDTLIVLAFRSFGMSVEDLVGTIGDWAVAKGCSQVVFSAMTEAHRRLYKRVLH